VLRVKTSSLPITLTATAAGAAASASGGTWHTDSSDAQALRMRRLAPDGSLLATLVATAATPAARPTATV
jgi:hypothetical protein